MFLRIPHAAPNGPGKSLVRTSRKRNKLDKPEMATIGHEIYLVPTEVTLIPLAAWEISGMTRDLRLTLLAVLEFPEKKETRIALRCKLGEKTRIRRRQTSNH